MVATATAVAVLFMYVACPKLGYNRTTIQYYVGEVKRPLYEHVAATEAAKAEGRSCNQVKQIKAAAAAYIYIRS